MLVLMKFTFLKPKVKTMQVHLSMNMKPVLSNNILHTTMCPDVYNVMAKEEARNTNMKRRGRYFYFHYIFILFADIMVTSQRKIW